MEARFVERDNGAENRRAVIAQLRRHGRPVAVCADLLPGVDLDAFFAETEARVVAPDFTVRFRNRFRHIPEKEPVDIRPGAKVVVERRLNGEVRLRLDDRYLAATHPGHCRPDAPAPAEAPPPKPRKAAAKPPKPDPTIPGAGTSTPTPSWPRRGGTSASRASRPSRRRSRRRPGVRRTPKSGDAEALPGPA